jgi:hypothetical protein
MALPGKLCIGILEEDNPQKSYFRFKPLLVAEGSNFNLYEVGDEFPEHGCLRIVPDKNESSRFKARMRRMGRYAMVDLRDHPDENDKIRPNKNYRGDDIEANAFIIYSDVVRELPEGMLVEIIAQDAPDDSAQLALKIDMPYTSRVMLSGCNPAGALWEPAPIEDIDGAVSLRRTDAVIDEIIAQRFDIPGFADETLSFVIANPGTVLYAPQPEASDAAPAQAVTEAAPSPAAPAMEAAPAPEAPKPWIYHDESMLPRPVDPRLEPREKAIAMQTGLNPRRGRSLQEIIDDKWRRSRMDQLGQSPETVTGRPILSPVDQAVDAVRAAWEHTQARPCIARAMSQISGLGDAMAIGSAQLESEAHAARLKAFDETKEQLTLEINALRQEHDRLHQELSDSLHLEMQDELDAHKERIRQLEKQESDVRARAEDARIAAESAKQAIGQLTDQDLTQRISEYAVNCRAADILMNMRTGALKPAAQAEKLVQNDSVSLPQLVERVRAHFAAANFHLSADDAVNLLACLVLDGYMLLTGPVGCGKTAYACLLGEALGLDRAGCMASYGANAEYADAPLGLTRIVLADDVNACPHMTEDIISRFDRKSDAKLIITAQDSATGEPLDLRLLDRSFMIRINAPDGSAPWERTATSRGKYGDVVTTRALSALFPVEGRGIAPQVLRAMAALRSALADYGVQISRRALDGMWAYCAAVTPHLQMSPMEAFDLAFAQRALPAILTCAPVEALHALPRLLRDMPRSLGLLAQPLAIAI